MAGQTALPEAQAPPRRYLTDPHRGAGNHGWDNEHSDLIIAVDDVFASDTHRYVVQDVLGQGTFGQVVRCTCEGTGEAVAVKVIKNQTAFYHQARVEVGVLQYLNKRADPEDRHHIVRLRDFFLHRGHLCLAFELMSVNLYELVKHNRFKGLSLTLLRVFIAQILDALTVLREANIIHCDLKPENVLLKSLDSGEVKVIDFGSACFENKTTYSYIQSRFYRSPEVLMGHPYNVAIDMWSLGCMAAELFLGLPLFPGASEHDLLARILEMLGPLPDSLLAKAAHTSKYFRRVEEPVTAASVASGFRSGPRYQLRSQVEFEALHGQPAPAGKRYFQHTKLADIIGAYPYKAGLSDEETAKESRRREAFLDFLMGVLDLDPRTRWSPRQALQHPFITSQPFRGPFQPSPDPHIPIRPPPFQPGSAPASSAFQGLAASPLSPEAHAQAHAAAMAAVSAHFSPRAAQQPFAGGSLLGAADRGVSMAGSYHSPAYSLGRMGPSLPHDPPAPGRPTRPGEPWAMHQLPPSGLASSYGASSLMRSGSLAAALQPWQQQQQQQQPGAGGGGGGLPIGSLEALRATWRAPHNSYVQGGYGLGRSLGRHAQPAAHGSLDPGLPPLPVGSWQDGGGFAAAIPGSAAAGQGAFSGGLAGLQPIQAEQYGSSLGGGASYSGRSAGLPPPSPQHAKGAQSRRESLDFSSVRPRSAGRQGSLMGAPQAPGGAMRQLPGQGAALQRLVRMASGDCETIPEPSDWDPLYSDDQLLSEEQAQQQAGDAAAAAAAFAEPSLRPRLSDSGAVPSGQAELGSSAAAPGWQGGAASQPWPGGSVPFDGFRPPQQQQQQAAFGSQLDFRALGGGSLLPSSGGGGGLQGAAQPSGLLSRQMAQASGGLLDSSWAGWQGYGSSGGGGLQAPAAQPLLPEARLPLPGRQPVSQAGLRPQQGP